MRRDATQAKVAMSLTDLLELEYRADSSHPRAPGSG